MGFWKRLLGSDKIVDGIYNGIDKSVFTSEERADHFLRILKAYEPFKLLQRFMALIVGIPYMFVWIVCAVFYIYGLTVEDLDAAKRMIDGSKELAKLNNEQLGVPFAIILSFAFGGGMLEGGIRAFKGKGS